MASRIIVVTGAAGCIGRAITRLFIEQGDLVVGLDINKKSISEFTQELQNGRHSFIPAVIDITNETAVIEKMNDIERNIGPINTLVNNAGGNITTLLSETSSKEWLADIELNLNAAFYTTKAVLSFMESRLKGNIINIGSVNGLSIFGDPGYSAAKAGLINFTKFVATEYGSKGVRANIICPGSVATKAWKDMHTKKPDLFNKFNSLCSLNKITTPEDVAELVRFTASKAARAMNGSTLVLDAGLTAGIPSVMATFTNSQ